MRGHGQKLTRFQERAVAAILTAESIELAALAVGVAASTLYRWLRRDEFRAALKAAQRAAYAGAIGDLQAGTRKAVKTLLRNADCGNKAIENDAAKAILDRATRGTEVIDLATDVAELREAIEQIQKERHHAGNNPLRNGRPS